MPEAAAASGIDSPLVEMEGITKRFSGVVALDDVRFELVPGEVHVLFGENGAGKSTLINIMAGTYRPDAGNFRFQGEEMHGLTPHQARLNGLSPVFQEFSLVPELTVQENLFLGHESSTWGVMRRSEMQARGDRVLGELGFDLSLGRKVRALPRAEQQMVEIAKALLLDVKVLILDEPTASLTEREVEKLFGVIERLKGEGVGVVYVSHRIGEIKRLADRVTVLRDGSYIATVPGHSTSETELVELMTGRTFETFYPAIARNPGPTALEVSGLTLKGGQVRDVDFNARAGEVLGIAGLVGCGKSELVRAVFGLEPIESGRIKLGGEVVAHPTPSRMLARRLCYFPSDRAAEGLAMQQAIRVNASMASLDEAAFARYSLIRRNNERSLVRDIAKRLQLKPANIERPVGQLSGGNMQKVLLARGLTRDIGIYLFDEPTIGIDVGAKVEVYGIIKELTEAGHAVVIVSSELAEVLHIAHRLYVMHRGAVVAELADDNITEQAVLSFFFEND